MLEGMRGRAEAMRADRCRKRRLAISIQLPAAGNRHAVSRLGDQRPQIHSTGHPRSSAKPTLLRLPGPASRITSA